MKKETLEEVAERLYPENIESIMDGYHDSNIYQRESFIEGAKWQQERSYSVEDMKSAFKVGFSIGYGSDVHAIDEKNRTCEEWFEQFKKK